MKILNRTCMLVVACTSGVNEHVNENWKKMPKHKILSWKIRKII